MAKSSESDATLHPHSSESRERMREQARVVADDVKELGSMTRDAARDTVREGRERAVHAYERGRSDLERRGEDLLDEVRSKPLQSVLIAAGAGVLIGMWLRRR